MLILLYYRDASKQVVHTSKKQLLVLLHKVNWGKEEKKEGESRKSESNSAIPAADKVGGGN